MHTCAQLHNCARSITQVLGSDNCPAVLLNPFHFGDYFPSVFAAIQTKEKTKIKPLKYNIEATRQIFKTQFGKARYTLNSISQEI